MKTIKIGRSSHNDIVINDSYASNDHLSITLSDDGKYYLKDLGSSNGTFVNGKKVTETFLQTNDIVKIGNTILQWKNYFKEPILNQELKGKIIQTLTFGRNPSNDVVINSDEYVSNKHAVLNKTDLNEYQIVDLNSSNGTFVNGKKIDKCILHTTDNVRIGRTTINWLNYFQNFKGDLSVSFSPVPTKKKSKHLVLYIILGLVIISIPLILIFMNLGKEELKNSITPDNKVNTTKVKEVKFEIIEELPIPPKIDASVVHHQKTRKDKKKLCNDNKKELLAACDYRADSVRNLAVILAGKSAGEFNLGQICEIYDYCKKNWKYVNDPASGDFISSASNTISAKLNGDCDDFAVLQTSLLLAIGADARVNYVFGNGKGHAFCDVNIGNTSIADVKAYLLARYKDKIGLSANNNYPHYKTDDSGNKWLNLDWFSDYPGGDYFDATSGTTFYILDNYCETYTKP